MSDLSADVRLIFLSQVIVASVAVPSAIVVAICVRVRRTKTSTRLAIPHRTRHGLFVIGILTGYLLLLAISGWALDYFGVFRSVYGGQWKSIPIPESDQAVAALIGPAGERASHYHTTVVAQLISMWASVVTVPVLTFLVWLTRDSIWEFRSTHNPSRLAYIPAAVTAWLILGSLTLAINFAVTWLMSEMGRAPVEHPLSRLGITGDGVSGLLFVASACVATPVFEELLFRALILPWAVGRHYGVWLTLGFAVVLAITAISPVPSGAYEDTGGAWFVLTLGAIQFLAWRFGRSIWPRLPSRTVLAVWSTSALFAAAHSTVWPTPIPLFVLGIGLGYLSIRYRSVLPAVIVHVLFNATSTVFVALRS